MFDQWFKKRLPEIEILPSTEGRLIYAIGDIHGRADLLRRLFEVIAEDSKDLRHEGLPVVVFLGDYVDRGPESKATLSLVDTVSQQSGLEVRLLRGNHEEALCLFLEDSKFGPAWATHGGLMTLASYGVDLPSGADEIAWEACRLAFSAALPQDHRRLLARMESKAQYGDYLFVHAGVRPGVPIADQVDEDLLWIRDAFLNAEAPCEKVVVHGHTPSMDPFVGRWRIGLDTGAYATGVLSAIRLLDEGQHILRAQIDR